MLFSTMRLSCIKFNIVHPGPASRTSDHGHVPVAGRRGPALARCRLRAAAAFKCAAAVRATAAAAPTAFDSATGEVAEEVELVVVPGVSFDRRGHRLGYGRGYYDSLLKKVKGCTIGLAYDMQIVERVPDEPHDVAVDMVVTQSEIIRCSKPAGESEIHRMI